MSKVSNASISNLNLSFSARIFDEISRPFLTSPDLWSSKVRGRQKIDIQSMRTPKAIAAEGCSFLVGRLCANQFEKVCRCLQMIPPTWVPTFPHGLSKWSIHIRQTLNNFPLHHFPLHHLIPSSEPQNMTLSPHCTYFWPFHF